MLLRWGAEEALGVRAGRLTRSSFPDRDGGENGLVQYKESIPAIKLVRVGC